MTFGLVADHFRIMSLPYTKPSIFLAAELKEVAASAQELLDALDRRMNVPLPEDFPKSQLQDICRSLIKLPEGTSEGCRAPLDYSRCRLPAIRREHVRIETGTSSEALLSRGTILDNKIAALISAVTTAWDEYRREASEEETDRPAEGAVLAAPDLVRAATESSVALDTSLSEFKVDVERTVEATSETGDELKRQLEDVHGLNRLSRAEVRMPRIVVGWMKKTSQALRSYPSVLQRTADKLRVGIDVAEIAMDSWLEIKQKTLHGLLDHIREVTFAADRIAARLQQGPANTPSENGKRSLPEACLEILEEHGGPLTAKQFFERLRETEFSSKILKEWTFPRPYKRVYSALVIRSKKTGDVINVGGGFWALSKWLTKGDVKKMRRARESDHGSQHSVKTKLGIAAAKAKGSKFGQPKKMDADKMALAKSLFAQGMRKGMIAKTVGVSRWTLNNAFPEKTRPRRKSNTPKAQRGQS